MANMFQEWTDELLRENSVECIEDLTPEMLAAAIKETTDSIANESEWANGAPSAESAAMHAGNIIMLMEWREHLEDLMPDMHHYQFVLGVYDPDELPECVDFFVPETIDEDTLRAALLVQRDTIVRRTTGLPVETVFTIIMNETCAAIGQNSSWRCITLQNLRGEENLWEMQG